MYLNYDCIRDVLCVIAELQEYKFKTETVGELKRLETSDIWKNDHIHNTYEYQDVLYSLKQLNDSGLIDCHCQRNGRAVAYLINDITPAGHEFLDPLRDQSLWSITKRKATDGGIHTNMSLLIELAKLYAKMRVFEPEAFLQQLNSLSIM